MFRKALKKLLAENLNQHVIWPKKINYYPGELFVAFQENLIDYLMTLRKPFVYMQHIYFINFEDSGLSNPVWFNLIRDPISKFQSRCFTDGFKIS